HEFCKKRRLRVAVTTHHSDDFVVPAKKGNEIESTNVADNGNVVPIVRVAQIFDCLVEMISPEEWNIAERRPLSKHLLSGMHPMLLRDSPMFDTKPCDI